MTDIGAEFDIQALETDALHFSTDVWSSSVVIAGLVAVSLGRWLHDHAHVQADWLYRADAALGVSLIVIYSARKPVARGPAGTRAGGHPRRASRSAR